jgi:hypothetical protein
MSWSPESLPLRAAGEAESVSGILLARLGIEYDIVPSLTVRAGVDGADPGGTIGSRATFGVSVNSIDLPLRPSLDYAFMVEPYAPLGAHFITVRLHLTQ